VETTFLIEEAKAKLLSLYQQEESLGLHLEAKRHSLLHLKSESLRTDQVIREFERKRAFDLQQDTNDRSLSQKDMEEVEKLSRDILQEERIFLQLQALLEETKSRKDAFQQSLDRDRADREEIKAAIAKFSKKFQAAPRC
jgi:chromosome segregation ATPase